MDFQTGDIMVWKNGWPGHIGMIWGQMKGYGTVYIDATSDCNFMKHPLVWDNYNMSKEVAVYRAPWNKNSDADYKKKKLRDTADEIAQHAKYGMYRAVRLFAGSSEFKTKARDRLKKYKARQWSRFEKDKFVSTVTCAEAVILCYQLTFSEEEFPFFINLDAAHTMPATLEKWLNKNWTTVKADAHTVAEFDV